MVEILRRRGYIIFYIGVTLLYGLIVIAAFACQGIWYEERAEAYFDKSELKRDNEITVERILFVTELVLLSIFFIDLLLHIIGFGGLYLRKVQSITEIILIMVNAVVVFIMMNSITLS